MKIQVISDLHQEFGFNEFSHNKADILALAGDINNGIKGIQWIKDNIEIPVIYVLGNHEYYKGSYPKTLYKILGLADSTENIYVLEHKSVQIGGITFHGATLWTDFQLLGNTPRTYGIICQGKMNDYRLIRRDPSYSKLRSIDTYNLHQESIKWLKQSLATSTTSKNIVVTHHAPSIQSIPLEYKEDPVSSAYASNLEDLILEFQPNYWIHGHIHTPSDYMIGSTNVLCNPHGYIDEKYNGYKPELIVEL